jgi:hypothetical protein
MKAVEVISIVVIQENVVVDINSFKGNNEAEQCFWNKCEEFAPFFKFEHLTNEQIHEILDDGYFESSEYTICITHSVLK